MNDEKMIPTININFVFQVLPNTDLVIGCKEIMKEILNVDVIVDITASREGMGYFLNIEGIVSAEKFNAIVTKILAIKKIE